MKCMLACEGEYGIAVKTQKNGMAEVRDKREDVCVGMTLIECMLYLVLLSFLGVCMFQGIVGVQMRMRVVATARSAQLSMYAAFDALTRDIRMAPTAKNAWQEYGPERLRWKAHDKEIAWYVDRGRLCRSQKTYQKQNQRWTEAVVSVVASHVARIVFQPAFASRSSALSSVYVRCISHQGDSVDALVAVREKEGGYE